MIRYFLRLSIFGVAAFLLYYWAVNRLEFIALILLFVILLIFFMATFVSSVEKTYPNLDKKVTLFSPDIYSSYSFFFKFDKEGRSLFFPYGVSGKGYVLADIAKVEQIKKFLTVFNITTLLTSSLIILLGPAEFGWLIVLFLSPISYYWYRKKISKFTETLEVAIKNSINSDQLRIHVRFINYFILFVVLGLIGLFNKIYQNGFSVNEILKIVLFIAVLIYIYFVRHIER